MILNSASYKSLKDSLLRSTVRMLLSRLTIENIDFTKIYEGNPSTSSYDYRQFQINGDILYLYEFMNWNISPSELNEDEDEVLLNAINKAIGNSSKRLFIYYGIDIKTNENVIILSYLKAIDKIMTCNICLNEYIKYNQDEYGICLDCKKHFSDANMNTIIASINRYRR